jgi:hypothetical protein
VGTRDPGFVLPELPLDLRTNTFSSIVVPGAQVVTIWGANNDGVAVGIGTFTDTDHPTRGLIYDHQTGMVTDHTRPGYERTAFTAINDHGDVAGYNDFGTLGFVRTGNEYQSLDDERAGRLFPVQMANDGRIVGFWGDEPDIYAKNRGFLGTPVDGSYQFEPYQAEGGAPTDLTGINNHGELAGAVYTNGTDAASTVFILGELGAQPAVYPLPRRDLDPNVLGISDGGLVFGSVHRLELPENPDDDECGGHGHLHGTVCHCDDGYTVDPDDPGNCIPAG